MGIEVAEDIGHEQQPDAGLPALTPVADAVTTALAEVTSTNTSITQHLDTARAIALQFANVVADVRTTKGYEEIAKIRTRIREEGRFPIQRLKDTGSKMLGTMQRQFNQRCESIIEEIKGLEAPFQEQLDAEDARKENERRERAESEQRRKDGHLQAIAAINRMAMESVGLTPAELRERITSAQEIIVDESYEEFQGQAQQAKDEALRQLQGLLVAAVADEEDRRDAEEARARSAALAEQQAAAAREAQARADAEAQARVAAEAEAQALRDKVAAMEHAEQERLQREEAARAEQERAARERAEAIERRIGDLRAIGPRVDENAAELQARMQSLALCTLTADHYGDRLVEAIGILAEVRADVAAAYEQAVKDEEERAAAAQAARIQDLIDSIRSAGENALLAVQDGSADVAALSANLKVLADTHPTQELFGERTAEAEVVIREAIAAAELAIAQTVERDRLLAEQAEQRRQQEAAEAAARALVDAKRSNGEALYEAVRNLLRETMRSGDHDSDAYMQGRALLLQINPAETFED